MIVRYLSASPEGDIPLGPEDLKKTFKVTPQEDHPFLTLGDYFDALQTFLLNDRASSLPALIRDTFHKDMDPDDMKELRIRTEKHGALYHVASVEVLGKASPLKFALCTALSERGRHALEREFELMCTLKNPSDPAYLPRVYRMQMVDRRIGSETVSFAVLISEWLEDYHEWHLSMDQGRLKIQIWDQKQGYRFAGRREAREILKQAAKILTYYYDTREGRQIYPWHHAAGDFVVKSKDGVTHLKLTTVRGYEAVSSFFEEGPIDPRIAMIYFLLNLTVKIRLDRIDGTGELVWAENFSIEAALEGFFEGIKRMKAEKRYGLGSPEDVISLLKSFDGRELRKLFEPLLGFYRRHESEDFFMVADKLDGHCRELYDVIQRHHG